MIIHLAKQTATVKPMKVPESRNAVYIKYEFERNTEHLTPILRIGRCDYRGDRLAIDMSDLPIRGFMNIHVRLVDAEGTVLRKYEGRLEQHDYILFGQRPVRADLEQHVVALLNKIEDLKEDIVKITDEGEVI
jgi:hypothetical protein